MTRESLAGYVIHTLNGWAAITANDALLGYHATEDAARAAVAAYASSDPIATVILISE